MPPEVRLAPLRSADPFTLTLGVLGRAPLVGDAFVVAGTHNLTSWQDSSAPRQVPSGEHGPL